jgi:hypothetical protein
VELAFEGEVSYGIFLLISGEFKFARIPQKRLTKVVGRESVIFAGW